MTAFSADDVCKCGLKYREHSDNGGRMECWMVSDKMKDQYVFKKTGLEERGPLAVFHSDGQRIDLLGDTYTWDEVRGMLQELKHFVKRHSRGQKAKKRKGK